MAIKPSTVIRLLALLVLPSLCWAQTAYLQPPKVFPGDITDLIIEYESKIPSLYALDTTVLEDDFIVLDKSSKLFRIDDEDDVTNRMQWTIKISPRRSGKLELPPLKLGQRLTPRLFLEVVQPGLEEAAKQQVTLDIQAFPQNPYVAQQTIIKLRLLHNTPLIDGGFSEPASAQADIYRSGKESRYSVTKDGEAFDVMQRSILVFAGSAGELTLTPAGFRGQIANNTRSLPTPSRRINRSSNNLVLHVRDIPVEFGGQHWLPASDLQISESWDGLAGNLKVGDSINRHLTIIAKGLPADYLPEDLLVSNSDRVKVYADKVVRDNSFEGDDLIGSLNQTFVVVVTEAGDIQLPELRLSWWDVDEDVVKQAVIPERKITILDVSKTQSNEVWLAAVPAFILISVLAFYLRKIKPWLANRRSLKQACLSSEPLLAREGLLAWASRQWPHESIIGLFQIEKKIDSVELKSEIRRLDEVLFSANKRTWEGDRLYRLLLLEQRRLLVKGCSDQSGLPKLYAQTPVKQ